jgi:hypothetical protein
MKVKVNRLLRAGKYNVNFEVSDFTQVEVSKMSSFGVPSINLRITSGAGTSSSAVPITQINKTQNAIFGAEHVAKEYEEQVLAQIRTEMQRLRESEDGFSSSEEVNL